MMIGIDEAFEAFVVLCPKISQDPLVASPRRHQKQQPSSRRNYRKNKTLGKNEEKDFGKDSYITTVQKYRKSNMR